MSLYMNSRFSFSVRCSLRDTRSEGSQFLEGGSSFMDRFFWKNPTPFNSGKDSGGHN